MVDYYAIMAYSLIGLTWFGLGGRFIYINYIRPFLSYKLVIFDVDDEFIHIVRKNKAIVIKEEKGYQLFGKKEFYSIPLIQEEDKKLSKRDDTGMVTYYYWRNNTKPIHLINASTIETSSQSNLLSKIIDTKVIDSAVLGEKTGFHFKWWYAVIIIVLMLVALFWEQITKLIGVS